MKEESLGVSTSASPSSTSTSLHRWASTTLTNSIVCQSPKRKNNSAAAFFFVEFIAADDEEDKESRPSIDVGDRRKPAE